MKPHHPITGSSRSAAKSFLVAVALLLTTLNAFGQPADVSGFAGVWAIRFDIGLDRVYQIAPDGSFSFTDRLESKTGNITVQDGQFIAKMEDRIQRFTKMSATMLKVEAFASKSAFDRGQTRAVGTGTKDSGVNEPGTPAVAMNAEANASKQTGGNSELPLRFAGSRRGQFIKLDGRAYEVTGSWAAMNKLVNAEADVAIIDIEWAAYSQVIRETLTDQPKFRVTEQQFTGLRGQPIGSVNLFFAHNLKEVSPDPSPDEVKSLLTRRNWNRVGGPDAPFRFAEWPDILQDSYKGRTNTHLYTPVWLFLAKQGISSFASIHMREGAALETFEAGMLCDRVDTEKLVTSWKVMKQPVLRQPLFAIFRELNAERITGALTAIIDSGVKRGDIVAAGTSDSTLSATVSAPASVPAKAIKLKTGWDGPMQGGSKTLEDLAMVLNGFGTANPNPAFADIEIFNGVKYLMPLDEAVKALGLNQRLPAMKKVVCPGFPKDSMSYISFDGIFNGHFNRLDLVVDSANQVVCVQLVDERPKDTGNYYGDGEWLTFNFVGYRVKAMSYMKVQYDVYAWRHPNPTYTGPSKERMQWISTRLRPGVVQSSVRRVDSLLRNKEGKAAEECQWYVPLPLAELIHHCIQTAQR